VRGCGGRAARLTGRPARFRTAADSLRHSDAEAQWDWRGPVKGTGPTHDRAV